MEVVEVVEVVEVLVFLTQAEVWRTFSATLLGLGVADSRVDDR